MPSFYKFVGQQNLMNQFKAADFWESRLDEKRGLTGGGLCETWAFF